jgi:S1-C subfamily serine protease
MNQVMVAGLAMLLGVAGAKAAEGNQPFTVLPAGARVTYVAPGGPGSRAGLERDDVILQIDDIPVTSRDVYFKLLRIASWQGAPVELTISDKNNRNGPPVKRQIKPINGKLFIDFVVVRDE